MSRFMVGACAALAMGILGADDASAQYYRGGYGIGYSSPGFSIGINTGRGYGGNFGYGRTTRVWHNTSHYDFHPTTVYRHGNHYHVQPAHYDFHQTGHVDRIRGGRVIHGRSRTVYGGHHHW
ncbi:MAG: hypothetical protein R3C19_12855 [Planctomycetaceae bacterium]